MSKSSLLAELQKLKPRFPEVEFYVPEWDRKFMLRALSVRDGREVAKANDGADDNQQLIRTLAYALVNDDAEQFLANQEGIELLETLSAITINNMARTFVKLNQADDDAEKNSDAGAGDGSSINSPSPSDARSLN